MKKQSYFYLVLGLGLIAFSYIYFMISDDVSIDNSNNNTSKVTTSKIDNGTQNQNDKGTGNRRFEENNYHLSNDGEVIFDNHYGKPISEILNEENYDKIGINPEEYETLKVFLEEFKSFTGVNIDPINDNFSIGLERNGDITYVPFRYQEEKEKFENETRKNIAILEIYEAYKNDKVFGGSNTESGEKIIFIDERRHPKTYFLNEVFSGEKNPYNFIKGAEKKGLSNLGSENGELLGYLYDLTGEYGSGLSVRDELCENNKECEEKKINLEVNGKVTDSEGDPISGADVVLLNTQKKVTTNQNGIYKMNLEIMPFAHLRVKVDKDGYSNGFMPYSLNDVVNNPSKKFVTLDFVLHKADAVVNINKENIEEYEKGKFLAVDKIGVKYFIPKDGLYFKDGEKYSNIEDISIYLYYFDRTDDTSSLLSNDALDEEQGFLGNTMVTFGMPYIQIFDNETNKELFTYSSNPMLLQTKVKHLQEILEGTDEIYNRKFTENDLKFLINQSEQLGGYPIDYEFLKENNLLKWAPWWTLDRKTGIWYNIGHRVLNKNGLVEMPFYHTKDN